MAKDRTTAEVAKYLRDFLEETGGKYDWDDFTRIPIKDTRLEAIRLEATDIDLPITTPEGWEKLRELVARAEALR